jgi:ribonuclease HI
LRFNFPTTNNQAEYEALLAGLQTAKDIGAQNLVIKTDSQLVANQVNGTFKVHEDTLKTYLQRVNDMISSFAQVMVEHIPRE